MIVFPNAKINLGLNVIEKRNDGYHTIDSVFYPVKWEDALEIIENKNAGKEKLVFSQSGIIPEGSWEHNLVVKAYRMLAERYDLPPAKIHLHKTIPTGAGLGGGSADAAFTLTCLNELFQLQLNELTLLELAGKLGSDCAFFIRNQPVSAYGRGDVFEPAAVQLSGYSLVIIWPGIHSNTAEAYRNIRPEKPIYRCAEICSLEIEEWKEKLKNDFETGIFNHYPLIRAVKSELYAAGAVYASMSGSGSAVYGIFKSEIPNLNFPKGFLIKKLTLE